MRQAGLVSDTELEMSDVVANCAMNRERVLYGSNGYDRELGIDVVAELARRHRGGTVRWLDLCCGSGRALTQAADHCSARNLDFALYGLDLVDHFVARDRVAFAVGSVTSWSPPHRFDVVSCVHGLHYVGDKLDAIARAVSWLTADGLFVANFDPSLRWDGSRRFGTVARSLGLVYDARRRRLTGHGHADIYWPYRYLGSDPTAGPNYTGQPAVNSHYTGTTPL